MPTALKTRPPLSPPEWLASAELAPVEAVLVGGLAAAAVGFVAAIPLMRLSGLAAAIATFSLLIIIREVIRNWDSLTGGLQTLVGVPFTSTLWSVMAWAVVSLVIAHVYQQTRWGLRLRASREDEPAAAAAGIDVRRERRIAFVLSAFLAGVSGALYAGYLGAIGPDGFYLPLTFLIIAMLVVGGVTTLTGAVVGTVAVTVVSEILRRVEEGFDLGFVEFAGRAGIQEVGVALLMLIVLMRRPNGLAGGRELSGAALSGLVRRVAVARRGP
jgi:branched-chain amino acid transport system permease protein